MPLHGSSSRLQSLNGNLNSVGQMSGNISQGGTMQGSLSGGGAREVFYDTTAHWNAQTTFIAKKGVIYVYSDHGTVTINGQLRNVPGMKVGDGTSYLIDMPFVNDDCTAELLEHISDGSVHIQSGEREFWNNKAAAYADTAQEETLVLSNTSYMVNGTIINYNIGGEG